MNFSVFFSSWIFASSGHNLFWYWDKCDGAAKVVIGIIMICSVWSFTAIFQKLGDLKRLREKNRNFDQNMVRVNSICKLTNLKRNQECPFEALTFEALKSYNRHRGKILDVNDVQICMGHVENAIQRSIARVMVRYEKSMVLLSTFVSGGPFLGLLGTVWGVIVTFGALTEKATISQLAPGVSGALLATAAGLLLAIPAVFAYNYLLTTTKQMTTELENFASQLADQIELEMQENLRNEENQKAFIKSNSIDSSIMSSGVDVENRSNLDPDLI